MITREKLMNNCGCLWCKKPIEPTPASASEDVGAMCCDKCNAKNHYKFSRIKVKKRYKKPSRLLIAINTNLATQ